MEAIQAGTLYLVGTPIGNLDELSRRAERVLGAVDYILCEDCRHTLGLLNTLGIKKPLKSHHKFNERATLDDVLGDLRAGKTVALVTDAGMPCVSDPGTRLVAACREAGLPCRVVSGPCAAVDALALSGFDSSQFCFVGFLPGRARDRRALLARFAAVPATLIFYVPPHALNEDLAALFRAYGPRRACLAREMTKLHEEVIELTLSEAPALTARGEYVVIVEGAREVRAAWETLSTEEHLRMLRAEGTDRKTAVKTVAAARGLTRNEVYQLTVGADGFGQADAPGDGGSAKRDRGKD